MISEKQTKEYFASPPPLTADIGEAKYIPIDQLENQLDLLEYSTRNFQYQVIKDGYANLVVMASLEVWIMYQLENGEIIHRSFVGGCNFPLMSIAPNQHFIATAKSECMKNAASDISQFYGRGLNKSIEPPDTKGTMIAKKVVKSKPDAKILQQFANAIQAGDEATIIMLSNIYEIKTERDVEEK
jgi:hypothetical protein